ncbi:hypothetical protein RHGRI_012722 [Rhododendron griersonianum]|uniref:Uncharacterized protein n=1 Tax=Rhododendron griersonianum TaxID=479676 RepID=A0AAV6KT28_9ERIC|nr:hypothetical protein RHGRI_012722 [Rhododendron griersonianum]
MGKAYTVFVGRQPGVYDTWEEASNQRICTHHVHIKTTLKWKLEDDDPRLPHIEKAGFGWVRQLTSFNSDQDLLKLFYSRFRSDTCTFSLGGKKYIISLEDFACLTGLSVDGQAIIWKENKDIYTLCENVLGRKLTPEGCESSAIKFKWLRDTFEELEDGATEDDVKFSAKAYILYLLGHQKTFMGSSMLALLVENLKKDPSNKSDIVNLGGNAALLKGPQHDIDWNEVLPIEIWDARWEHIIGELDLEDTALDGLNVHEEREQFREELDFEDTAPDGLDVHGEREQFREVELLIQDHATVEDEEQSRVRKQRSEKAGNGTSEILKLSDPEEVTLPDASYDRICTHVDGVPSCDLTPQLPSLFKVSENYSAQWEHLIGVLDFEDAALPNELDVHEEREQLREVEQQHLTEELPSRVGGQEQSRVRKRRMAQAKATFVPRRSIRLQTKRGNEE